MSKRTEARKLGDTGGFLSRAEMNEIRHLQAMNDLEQKRRQAEYDKSPRRRKDGKPYQASNRNDAPNDVAAPWRTRNWRKGSKHPSNLKGPSE